MRKPEELNSMLRHAAHHEKSAKMQWVRARQQEEQAQRQLQELTRFAQDYGQATAQANSMTDLLNRKHFIARLHTAIGQQQQVCQQAHQATAVLQQQWQKQQQNLKALDQLKEKRQRRLDEHRARLEQKTLDEFAIQSLGKGK